MLAAQRKTPDDSTLDLDNVYRDAASIPALARTLDVPDSDPQLNHFFTALKGTGHRGVFRHNDNGYLVYIGCVMEGRTVVRTEVFSLPELYARQHCVPLPLTKWHYGLWRRRLAHDSELLKVKRRPLPKPRLKAWTERSFLDQLLLALTLDGLGLLTDLQDKPQPWMHYATGFATQWCWKRVAAFSGQTPDFRLLQQRVGEAKLALVKLGLVRYRKDADGSTYYRLMPDYAFGEISSLELLRPYLCGGGK